MSTAAREDDTLAAVGFMLGAVFLLSTMDVAFKHLVGHYSSLQVTFLRCILSAPLFATWMVLRRPALFRTANWRGHTLRGLFGLMALWALGECLREMPLADAYAIFFAAPLIITVLSGPVMKEPAGPVRMGAALVGFIGVIIVLEPGTGGLITYGAAMALVAVGCYVVVVFLLRALGREEHSVTVAFWYTAVVAAISGILLFGRWAPLRGDDLWPLVVLGITGTLGQLMIVSAYRRASAAVVAPLDYLHMIWAVLYGWWIWNDLPSGRVWLGTGVIIAAGLVIVYREHQQNRPVSPPGPPSDGPVQGVVPDSSKK